MTGSGELKNDGRGGLSGGGSVTIGGVTIDGSGDVATITGGVLNSGVCLEQLKTSNVARGAQHCRIGAHQALSWTICFQLQSLPTVSSHAHNPGKWTFRYVLYRILAPMRACLLLLHSISCPHLLLAIIQSHQP